MKHGSIIRSHRKCLEDANDFLPFKSSHTLTALEKEAVASFFLVEDVRSLCKMQLEKKKNVLKHPDFDPKKENPTKHSETSVSDYLLDSIYAMVNDQIIEQEQSPINREKRSVRNLSEIIPILDLFLNYANDEIRYLDHYEKVRKAIPEKELRKAVATDEYYLRFKLLTLKMLYDLCYGDYAVSDENHTDQAPSERGFSIIRSHSSRMHDAKYVNQDLFFFQRSPRFKKRAIASFFLLEDALRLYEIRLDEEKKNKANGASDPIKNKRIKKLSGVIELLESVICAAKIAIVNGDYKKICKAISESALIAAISDIKDLRHIELLANKMLYDITSVE